MIEDDGASIERPIYSKIPHGSNSNFYMIVCDEGWRRSIVCEGLRGFAADWLLGLLVRRPYPEPEHQEAVTS